MEILKSKHFRNGITGVPFDAGVVLQQGTEYLVVQFDEKHTAAFKMIDGKVNFAEDMRGDYFSDTFKMLLERERNICDCGCGHKIGSLEFIRLHVESEEEQDRRLACEQQAEEQAAHEQQQRDEHDETLESVY